MDTRTNVVYGVTGITPGMALRPPRIGSQYLPAMVAHGPRRHDALVMECEPTEAAVAGLDDVLQSA